MSSTNIDIILQDNYSETLIKLKFIAKIKVDQKINITKVSIEDTRWTNWLNWRRFWEGDSRKKTREMILCVINRAFELILIHLNSPLDKNLCINLLHNIIDTRSGLYCIQRTYMSDSMFSSQIETILEDIKTRSIALKTQHPDLFESIDIPENFTTSQLYENCYEKDFEEINFHSPYPITEQEEK